MSQENVKTIASMYEAFAQGDMPYVLGLMHPKIEWREADNFPYADGNPYIGPDAVLAGVFGRLGVDWDGFAATPHDYLDAGEVVIALGHYTGSSTATGKKVKAQFAHVITLAGGKVTKFQQYADTAQVRDAMSA